MALRELCPHNEENIYVETQGVGDVMPATSEGLAAPRNGFVQIPKAPQSHNASADTF